MTTKTSTVSEAVNELTKQITSLYRQREQAIVRELTALAAKYLDARPHLDGGEVLRRATDTWCRGGDESPSAQFVNAFYSLAERRR
jgi:hypothetical protein